MLTIKYQFKRVNLAWHDQNRFDNLPYFGNFLLNRTSEKCHTQQLQTHHALRNSQSLQSCLRSHARPVRLLKPPMPSLREVPPWHVWCGGPAQRKRDAPRLPHMFELPRPRDFRRGHCCGYELQREHVNTTYRVHPCAKIVSHDTMISFQHPGTRYHVLAVGILLANKQVEHVCEPAQGRYVMQHE